MYAYIVYMNMCTLCWPTQMIHYIYIYTYTHKYTCIHCVYEYVYTMLANADMYICTCMTHPCTRKT